MINLYINILLFLRLSSYQANLEPEQVSGGLGALAQNRGQPVVSSIII